jgi:hypothetical protein
MYKFILGVVVGLALAAACSAVYLGLGGRDSNQKVTTTPDAAVRTPVIKKKIAAHARPAPVAEAADAPVEEVPTPAAATEAPAAAPVAGSFDDDAEALVKGLSGDQEEKLTRLLNERAMKRMMEEAKYRTASSWRIDMLSRQGKPELRLSDAQKQQLKQAREALKPRMDAALGSYWTRSDELTKAISENFKGGAMTPEQVTQIQEKNQPLYAELNLIRQQTVPLQQQLDQEFLAAANTILTPEQQKAVTEMGQGWTWSGSAAGGGGAWSFGGPGGGGNVIVQPGPPPSGR